jgi:hypothetical protein
MKQVSCHRRFSWLTKSVNDLIGAAAHAGIENRQFVIIPWVMQHVTARIEHKASGFLRAPSSLTWSAGRRGSDSARSMAAAGVSACADSKMQNSENAYAARYGTDFVMVGPPMTDFRKRTS